MPSRLPGGYVYVTRQLMVLMDDEVAACLRAWATKSAISPANHAHARQAAARRNSVRGSSAHCWAASSAADWDSALAQMSQQRAQLATLSFSRDQEYQADTLGDPLLASQRATIRAGGPGVLAALTRASALEARLQGRDNRQTPEWASTHPLSENRMQRALAAGPRDRPARNRDCATATSSSRSSRAYFVDDDPAQGIIEGRSFTHPDLRIQFAVPLGYLMQNGTREVSISGSAGQAQFSGGRFNGSIENYIYRVFQELTGGRMQLSIPPPQRIMINGLPAAYTTARANTSSGAVDASVIAYQWDQNTIYHFVMLTRAGAGIDPFAPMVNSLRRITPAEAAAIRPRVIDVVVVRPATRSSRLRAGWPIATSSSNDSWL